MGSSVCIRHAVILVEGIQGPILGCTTGFGFRVHHGKRFRNVINIGALTLFVYTFMTIADPKRIRAVPKAPFTKLHHRKLKLFPKAASFQFHSPWQYDHSYRVQIQPLFQGYTARKRKDRLRKNAYKCAEIAKRIQIWRHGIGRMEQSG